MIIRNTADISCACDLCSDKSIQGGKVKKEKKLPQMTLLKVWNINETIKLRLFFLWNKLEIFLNII